MNYLRLSMIGLILIFYNAPGWSQDKNDWIITGGAIFSKESKFIGEVGVINGLAVEDLGIITGFKVGTEFNADGKFFIAPKFGAEFDFAFISLKANIINYTDFKHYEPKFTPEIGISIMGYLNLTYGYNISLSEKLMNNVPTHRFCVSFNIPLSTHEAP